MVNKDKEIVNLAQVCILPTKKNDKYMLSNPALFGPQLDVANANNRKKVAEVYFFFAEWCPHCKNAKPEWVQFKEEYDKKVVNDYEISCIEIDCTNENNQDSSILISKYKIEGYPTILMMVNNNRIDYDAKVTKSGLEQLVISATN
jgi:thiol-disulfide isomerase/thioredoxin